MNKTNIDMNRLPEHIAILMDGNGRWAKKHKLPIKDGHYNGMKAMKKVIKRAGELGIKNLTVFTFSTQNWNRSKLEIKAIFDLIVIFVDKELKELHEANVKANILGDYSPLPKKAKERLKKTFEVTKNNTGLNFNMCLNYGGTEEILNAARELFLDKINSSKSLKELKTKIESTQNISDQEFRKFLYTKNLPDPDLIIRTSGEYRLSNFLLYQSAYSEFLFSKKLWPDFNGNDLDEAIIEYQKRDRRFGKRK